jgi:8-oxo-dGTP pyrophosphatase MutT (NUDIX family)
VAISPYIRNLRATIGHTLLLLPSVAVLPRRPDGGLLLVQNIETGQWQTIGGAIEPDESPRAAATREALEEAGVTVELTRLLDVLGGPEFRITYPNGDMTAYVSAVYEAVVTSGTPRGDEDETSAAAWWAPGEIEGLPMDTLTRALLRSISIMPAPRQGPGT